MESSTLKRWKRKLRIKFEKLKHGIFLDVHSDKLKKDVEFILYNLPKPLIKGIEIIEEVFEVKAEPHQIIVKETMNAMDIKRIIGRYVYREKRWIKQEDIARKLLAEEKINEARFYSVYNAKNYLEFFEIVNGDIFAVYFGNETMTLDEIGVALNSLYIKAYNDKKQEEESDGNIASFIEDLFAND